MTENKSPEKGTKETVDQVAKELEQTSEGAMKQATSQLNQAKETKSDPKASPAQQKQDAQKAAEAMDRRRQQPGAGVQGARAGDEASWTTSAA